MNICITTIPHEKQRYATIGDWFIDPDGTWQIRVSKMNDWRYECLVGLHELVELKLCLHSGITQKMVDRFDMKYEAKRQIGNEDEPGDDPKAPYMIQHCVATGVERIVAAFLGVCWNEYEEKINSL